MWLEVLRSARLKRSVIPLRSLKTMHMFAHPRCRIARGEVSGLGSQLKWVRRARSL
jgi:hypothetical protein